MPVAVSDLETYLGVAVDAARASLLIGLATTLAAGIVDPLPDGADAVILSAAGRAYTNPTGATSESVGPFQVSRPSAGVYLTKAERATLRRGAGVSGAFSVDLLGVGYPDSRFPDTP